MSRGRHGRIRPQHARVERLESKLLLAADTGTTAEGDGVAAFVSDEAYSDWVVAAAVERWQGLFGQPAYGFGPDVMSYGDAGLSMREIGMPVPMAADSSVAVSADASSTNTQVAGVDEADLVETDGELLYTLGSGRLSIVAGISTTPELLGQFDLPSREQAAGMFLAGSRLTILTTSFGDRVPEAWGEFQSPFWKRFTRSPHATITVLDVSDPQSVTVASRTRVDGQLVASRMVAGQLRLVMNHAFVPPTPAVIPPLEQSDLPTVSMSRDVSPLRAVASALVSPAWRWTPEGTYESQASYVERIAEELIESMQPKVFRYDAAGLVTAVEDQVAATSIDIPANDLISQLTTVAVVEVAADGEPAIHSVGLLTSGQTDVFASADSIYVFAGHAGMLTPPGVPVIALRPEIMVWEPPVTDVARIDVTLTGQSGPALVAVGSFEGTLLNRFAVGETDGVLQAVVQQRADGHGVVVLETAADSLEVVGSLGGIAADEQLYAARIVDNRAYFVTFRFTDPLFVVDLSVPTAPTLLGELHVPGYADHLQPLDDGLLLAIGRDADERSGRFLGLQLSLFDVNDPELPQLLHRYTFDGGRQTSTPITGDRWMRGDGDPLAMGFYPEKGVVTVPVTSEGVSWWWERPVDPMPGPDGVWTLAATAVMPWLRPMPKQALEVVHFDAETGIVPLGTIDHEASIERSVRVGDKLVAVSDAEVSVHDFTDPSTALASVRLDDQPHIPINERPLPVRPAAFTDLLEQGFPLFDTWAVQAIETVGDREVAYATHVSGAIHTLSRAVGDDTWAGFAFEKIRNLESRWLSPEARGRAAGPPAAGSTPPVATLVSDAILEKLRLRRDEDGRITDTDTPPRAPG